MSHDLAEPPSTKLVCRSELSHSDILTQVPSSLVPEGPFGANGTLQIPDEFADLVPAIAFQIPDIAALATLELKSLETGEDVACIRSQVCYP